MAYLVIGSYQQFDKDLSFTSTLYSYQKESSNVNQVAEEALLDEYYLSSELQGRDNLMVSYLDVFLTYYLCCLSSCL